MSSCKILTNKIRAFKTGHMLTKIPRAYVTSLEPRYGSKAGETRITVKGGGFSADQFSQSDDPNVGNYVYLQSASGQQYECATHKDGTTETQIMCYTPPGMPEEDHYVKVVVDGVTVGDADLCSNNPTSQNCVHKPRSSYTPTITSMTPQSGLPGTIVEMEGKMFTDRYGSNLPSATNSKLEKLLRVYAGPQDCEVKHNDTFYGLYLLNEDTDDGVVTCKLKGTSVGFYNASIIVEAPYGRSLAADNVYRVSRNDDIFMFQVYTDISNISYNMGSVAGGLILRINGNYFDDRLPYSPARAYVGDTVCEVTDVVIDEYVECTVAPDPQYTGSKFIGGRGVNFEYWTGQSQSSSYLDTILTLSDTDTGYMAETLDETYFYDVNNTMDDFVSRMTFYFSPPHTGEYEFMLYGDDGARLYINGSAVVTSTLSWESSARTLLDENTLYLMEITHYENSGDSYIYLKSKFYDTEFTNAWTGKAEQERQTLSISSTVTYDTQVLNFDQFTAQTPTQEVQTVGVHFDGFFRFGLFGVFTEPLSNDFDELTIQNAVNELPIWGDDEAVIVGRKPVDPPAYQITFQSNRGDFPDIKVIYINSSYSTQDITENVKGVPNMDTVAITMEGVTSLPFSVSTLTENTLQSAVDSLFESKCPYVFSSTHLSVHYEDFESGSSSYIGWRVKDTDAFCGNYALKNPRRIYRKNEDEAGIMLSTSNYVCFAYKGIFWNNIGVRYSYRDSGDGEIYHDNENWYFNFQADSDTISETWYYTCQNVYKKVFDVHQATEHRLEEVWVYRASSEVDVYVDSVFIGREATTDDPDADLRRLSGARPNRAFINAAYVSSSTATEYSVTLVPFDCGYDFPLFELANEQVMSVTRTSEASPPVTGFVDITFNGNGRSGLNVSLEADQFNKELRSIEDIGALSVEKRGDCANFAMSVTFLTLPGDLPEMTVTYGDLQGIDAAGSISTNTNGGLYYDPLTGDMVSTVHDQPQVRLYINDVPTSCTGDCSFQWDSSVTPSATSVTPTSGSLGDSVTISGSGFSAVTSENTVTIGDIACNVTASTTSSVTCDVGNGPLGLSSVIVTVEGKGSASGSVDFTYTADILSISPSSGTLGGGMSLTIYGYGFKHGTNVTINSAPCEVTRIDSDEIECIVPPSSTAGSFSVDLTFDSGSLTYNDFTYDESVTPKINSVVPNIIDVKGENITIAGTDFSVSAGNVLVGSEQATILSWTDSQIEIEVTDIGASGSLDLKIDVSGNGFAVNVTNLELPKIDVSLRITNVYPLQGSLLGGTELTISGAGFGADQSSVTVTVGNKDCALTSLSYTRIICEISDAGVTHHVTNNGVDPAFGEYYAFDKPYITITEGDKVQWSWDTPTFINDIAHAIMEVDSPSSTEAKVGGFSSGTPSKTGHYIHQFNQVGTFYVWSGYVDVWGIKNYAGTINVVSSQSSLGEIDVQVGNAHALHNVGGSSEPVDSSACQSTTSVKSGCTDSLPSGGDSDKFNFAFFSCSTPIVNSVSVNNGTTQTEITITGEGFSTTECQNEVMFGDVPCTVTMATETRLTCNLDKTGEPELGIYHQLSMRVQNRGAALINIQSALDSGFAVIPNIDGIHPMFGSLAGGAFLTISGFGFGEDPFPTVGSYPCLVIESSYSEIVCETPASSMQGEMDVEVTAYVGSAALPSRCEMGSLGQCKYVYAQLWTPAASSISPSAMSSATSFTISGSSFGTSASEVEVIIGGEYATIDSVTDTAIVASVDNLPAGDNDVLIRIKDYGNPTGSLTVTSTPTIDSVTPSTGSIHGDTAITITGNGFVVNDTVVEIDGTPCNITFTDLSEVVCITAAHAAETVSIDVTSNGESFPSESFTYELASTPTVSSISPTFGLAGDTLSISGSNFDGGIVVVFLELSPCVVTYSDANLIECTVGNHSTGMAWVFVHVEGRGASNSDVEFEYQLSISGINPVEGGTAGGQTVTITGTGFDSMTTATICGLDCSPISITSSQYMCRTSANTDQVCDVDISVNGLTKTLSSSYEYKSSLTPTISGVDPVRGGTGGGASLTISGSGFGSDTNSVTVEIDGSECTVNTVTDTEIVCTTGSHLGSTVAKVEVQISGNGIAEEASSGDADYRYIDVWSSPFTWGGGPIPQAGEFVIVPEGMTLLLDVDTPVLSFLLIQGGELIFDEKDVELQSNIIMITDGGLLQVGTEAEPFQHKGIITLHGHHRSKELPIYGTKVLAVRNGTLELHGIEVPITWTRLASTASQGSTTIELVDAVEWNVGDEIVIAATGNRHTQSENEKATITAISGDKRTLTLAAPLEAEHVGTEETFDGTLVEFRAEVGLLTHNVVVRGNQDPQWEDEIKACPKGFNTGEFATQTCFLGRFGDEIGSSQFGAMILVHAPVYNTHEAQAKISYTEVTFAGQAFRLGRYPIHFHLNGDMSTSYVRGCGIHHTFNRAVNIHGTHNTLVEKTVIYNIMGGAFFLEDGIETGNTIQNNLAVFVRESSSLLNDDITPASFWVTNPNNTIQNNAAAGGTHFGFWYRMHNHPDGPSFTPDVCPKNVPLGVFRNNSAHSFGWFGLWIFEDYFPLKGGCGGTEVEPAVFESLYAWNNDKGAEAVNSGALQFKDFILVQNRLAGYEGKKVLNVPQYTDDSPMIADSLIVGRTTVIPDNHQGCTTSAIVFPFGRGFRVKNVRFVNFDQNGCYAFGFTRIAGTCSFECGGYTYHTEGLSWINSPNKGFYAWHWEGILLDKDGTASDKPANWTILPTSGTLPDNCEPLSSFSHGIPASTCPPEHKWHRFAFNNPNPVSLEGKNFIFENEYGNSSVQYLKKRLTHKPGWMCALLGGATYKFSFEYSQQIENISFSGQFYDFLAGDYLFLKFAVKEFPDRLSIDGGNTFINATAGAIDPSTGQNGDWEWDNVNNELKLLVHATNRQKRGMDSFTFDRPYGFTSYKCYYTDCIPPPDPNTVPPLAARPHAFKYWDDATMWNMTSDGYVTNVGANGTSIPQDYEDVRILFESWVVVNMTSINKLGTLLLEGVLEFLDTPGAVYTIEADFIIIKGGRLIIGWPEDPFDGLATITLRGNHSSDYFDPGTGPTLGSKAIGVFGGLDLFGKNVTTTWTELAATANIGDDQIVLKDQVDWSVDDEIVIGPTGFDPWQTESFKIIAISPDNVTLTLNETLKYRHVAISEILSNGEAINVGAGVGLLTRNIKIIGEDYTDLYKESFGARVLVGLVVSEGRTYTGYARLSNVEFYHTGQEGFIEEYDPRFSVSFVAVGTVSNVKPSIVTQCSFHNGFNTAVGAFGIGSLEISDNVVFGTVGHGLRTSSNDTRMLHNFVSLMISRDCYQDRFEVFNPNWEAGIEAMDATNLILQGNLVSGSERFAYHIPALDCDDTSDSYMDNKGYANVMGVVNLPGDNTNLQCAKYSGFTLWKNHDYGIYFQDPADFLSENNILIENNNGLMVIIIKPASLGHSYAEKKAYVRNTTFVGQTSTFDCSLDARPSNDDNFELSSNARPSSPPGGGMVGLVIPSFDSGSNSAPSKPFINGKTYNALGGLTILEDVTFAKYSSSTCKSNFAISTSAGHDDGQHPVESSRTTLVDVDRTNQIVYHRPNVGKINSADCVDMDCDAKKKTLFKDTDGSFLGHIGSVISHSEFEWNGDSRRGLGDYRIPKEMVTMLDGTRIPYDVLAPNKGIIRNENCTLHSTWQAYECGEELNYEALVIESMDPDTETRRLSPVALLGNGYIDLINGPQDHGWCSGYTCRKRISTFTALVATDEEYLMHFTSTTPKHMRYRLLNVDPTEAIKLTVWYSRPNRLDVFVDGVFHIATNARIGANDRYIISMPTGNEFEPMIANGTGTNYFDKDRGELTFIIQGPEQIDVITSESIIVSFGIPALSVEEFFGDNLVENLAAFLNIPLSKVRIVNVVSASSNSRRRKRSGDGITVEIEIGDEPSADINSTVSNSISYDDLINLASDIVNECQVGNVSETLNTTGGCETVELPSTDPEVSSIIYETPSPDHLFFSDSPEIEYEGVPLRTAPRIRAADVSNNVVTILGTAEHPWEMTVSVRSGTGHPNNVLNGTLTVNCTDGWFNFTDLMLTHMGTDYILDFNVTYPPEAENFTLASNPFNVPGRPLKVRVYDKTIGDIQLNGPFTVTLDLVDSNTNEIITDIAWRQHTWTAEAQLLGNSRWGSLDGVGLSTSFDLVTGRAMFPSLHFTGFGMYYIQFRVVSNPPDFNITLNHKMVIKNPAHIGMNIERASEIQVKYNVDFNTLLPTEDKQNEFEQTILTEFANMWPDTMINVGSISEGSILVTFTVSGNTSTVNDTAYSLCESIYNDTQYSFYGTSLTLSPYMTIDGSTFYGVSCGEIPSDEDDDDDGDKMETYLIVIIVLLSLLLVAVVTIFIVWNFCIKPKTKTHDVLGGTQYPDANKPVEDYLFHEDTFSSMKFNSGLAPTATSMNVGEKRPLSGFSLNVNDLKAPSALDVKPGYLSPPAYYNPAKLVTPNRSLNSSRTNSRNPSPSGSNSSKNLRSHSPFEGRESPLPPVGLYESDYIRTPVDRPLTPVLPAPSPTV
ncbi:Fibrocystin-L [Mactra antiquata]